MRSVVRHIFVIIALLVVGIILIGMLMHSDFSNFVFGKVDTFLSERIDFNSSQWGEERIKIYDDIFGNSVEL